MKRIIFVIVFLIANAYGDTMDTIKADCEAKWGTNYRMIKYCVNQQAEAVNSLVDADIDNEIMSMCRNKWGNNFRMVKYCVNQQSEAKRSLGY